MKTKKFSKRMKPFLFFGGPFVAGGLLAAALLTYMPRKNTETIPQKSVEHQAIRAAMQVFDENKEQQRKLLLTTFEIGWKAGMRGPEAVKEAEKQLIKILNQVLGEPRP